MRLSTRPFAAAAILAAFVASSGCGPEVDLAKSAQIVDVTSGYYDMGVVNGKSKIVPQAIVHVNDRFAIGEVYSTALHVRNMTAAPVPVEIVGPSGEQRTIQVTLAERPLPVNIP